MDHLRTSEEERQRVVGFLRDCCAEGYLDPDELGERQSGALHSRTRGELVAFVADMPRSAGVLPGAVAAPQVAAVRRGGSASVAVAITVLLLLMALGFVPGFETLWFGGVLVAMTLFALVLFALFVSPWLAAGALVAWSVNRFRRPSTPPPPPSQPH